jgi:hypothetical protein
MSALILGFFAVAWFGWAQADPPDSWLTLLTVGMFLSLLIAIGGVIQATRHWSGPSALANASAMHRYNMIVIIEFGAAAIGVIILIVAGGAAYIAPWVCFVVGVHFWSLAPVLRDPFLHGLSIALVIIALLAALAEAQTSLAASAVTGAAAGAALLIMATRDLTLTFRAR